MKMEDQNQNLSTAKGKGDILEQHVEHLFKTANFKTQRNVRIASYEIDVLAELGDRKIVIECKNYQNSSLTIRNLIHQWSSKNKLINAHKIIIVVAGISLSESDKNLAAELDITLWGEDDLAELFTESLKPDSFKEILLDNISFRPLTISERWEREIMFELCLPAFNRFGKNHDEIKFLHLEGWLKRFILSELSFQNTDSNIRSSHIRLFVELKESEAKFVGRRNLNYQNYWDKLKSILASEDSPFNSLGRDVSGKYLAHMYELENEWENQRALFFESEGLVSLNIKLTARVILMITNDQGFQISLNSNNNNEIRVRTLENGFSIEVLRINQKEADTLDWILTSKHLISSDAQIGGVKQYFWYILSSAELIENLTRIIIEFFKADANEGLLDSQIEQQIVKSRF